jgi:hypothetical protein
MLVRRHHKIRFGKCEWSLIMARALGILWGLAGEHVSPVYFGFWPNRAVFK